MTTRTTTLEADPIEFPRIDRHASQRTLIEQGCRELEDSAHAPPPAPARRGPLPRSPKTVVAQVKPYDEELHAELELLLKPVEQGGKGFTQAKISKRTGVSTGLLSKYMGKAPVGDVAKQEAAFGDFLKNLDTGVPDRRKAEGAIFETFVSNRVWKICDETRKQGFISTIMGAPGIGKTCGARLYKNGTPEEDGDNLAIFFSLSAVRGGGTRPALVNAFFNNVDTRKFKKGRRDKEDWLVERFVDSDRLIIMDNAHLLSRGGLEWVLGFQDETGCGFACISNDDLKATMLKVQRAASRIGIFEELKVSDRQGRTLFGEATEEFLDVHWPEARKEIFSSALELVQSLGALRALRIATHRAKSLLGKKDLNTPLKAFQAAVAKLPTYQRLHG